MVFKEKVRAVLCLLAFFYSGEEVVDAEEMARGCLGPMKMEWGWKCAWAASRA